MEPSGILLDLTFVVRGDMMPPDCADMSFDVGGNAIKVVSGTYNDSLCPDFDCGGKPDVIIALNAGLFAYSSWCHVTDYVDEQNITFLVTDYNEFSGLNSASVGGGAARDSLVINPFRQPLALPVFSMNLPQFANGFFFVFNQVELDC